MYLEDLFVEPDQRGSGIGKKLLKELGKICRKRGYGRFEWSVLNWNEPAIGFYKSIGAKPLKEWTKYRLDGKALKEL